MNTAMHNYTTRGSRKGPADPHRWTNAYCVVPEKQQMQSQVLNSKIFPLFV